MHFFQEESTLNGIWSREALYSRLFCQNIYAAESIADFVEEKENIQPTPWYRPFCSHRTWGRAGVLFTNVRYQKKVPTNTIEEACVIAERKLGELIQRISENVRRRGSYWPDKEERAELAALDQALCDEAFKSTANVELGDGTGSILCFEPHVKDPINDGSYLDCAVTVYRPKTGFHIFLGVEDFKGGEKREQEKLSLFDKFNPKKMLVPVFVGN